jgi:hypothetical protein
LQRDLVAEHGVGRGERQRHGRPGDARQDGGDLGPVFGEHEPVAVEPDLRACTEIAAAFLEARDLGEVAHVGRAPQRGVVADRRTLALQPVVGDIRRRVGGAVNRLFENLAQSAGLIRRHGHQARALPAAHKKIRVQQKLYARVTDAIAHEAARSELLAHWHIGREQNDLGDGESLG